MEVEQADEKMQPATPMAQSTSVATEQAVEPAMSAPQERIEPIIPAEQKDKYEKQMQTSISTMNPKVGYDKIDEAIKASNSSTEHKKREEIEEKRRKRAGIFNAISDGVAALANVYFTSKGAPAVVYDENNSLSARARARWDEMDKSRKAEEEKLYLREKEKREEENKLAIQARAEARQARVDKENAEYRARVLENQGKQIVANEAHRKQQAEAEERRHKENLANRVQVAQINQAGANNRAKENADAKKAGYKYTAAKTARGKHIDFSDGKDNQVRIYETVWRGSMPQVFEAIAEDGVAGATRVRFSNTVEMEKFVKQNWTKSPKAKLLMRALSQIDPASSINIVEDEEDVAKPKSSQKGLGWGKSNNDNKINW